MGTGLEKRETKMKMEVYIEIEWTSTLNTPSTRLKML